MSVLIKALHKRLNPDYKVDPYRVSVTQLSWGPQQYKLYHQHYDEIETRVEDSANLIIGLAVARFYENEVLVDNSLKEEKLEWKHRVGRLLDADTDERDMRYIPMKGEVADMTLVGKPDVYYQEINHIHVFGEGDRIHLDSVVADVKTRLAMGFSEETAVKPEYEIQLNAYAFLLRKYGFRVDKLMLHYVLTGWNPEKAKQKGFPNSSVVEVEVPMWDNSGGQFEEYATLKMEAFYDAIQPDSTPRPCTAEERWVRGWRVQAVPKKKRALRVLDTEEEAYRWCEENKWRVGPDAPFMVGCKGLATVEPAQSIKCANYCPVTRWCEQWKEEQGEKTP
jgi:CRISPR/Cas system-associated exonuclease Cas4 (RecB family)